MSTQAAQQQTAKRRSSIGRRLILPVLAAVATTALLMIASSAWRETSRYPDSKLREITGLAHALAVTVVDPLARDDRDGVRKALWAMSRMPAFTYAKVENSAGQEVGSLGKADTRQADDGGLIPFRNTIRSEVPIHKDGKRIGTLTVSVSTSDLKDRLTSGLVTGVLAALLSALICFVVARRRQLRICELLERLTQTMRHVRETNDFTSGVACRSKDELGVLVDAFNDMLAQIHSRDERLAQHRASLEQTLQLRTRDLRAAEARAASRQPARTGSGPREPWPVRLATTIDTAEDAPIESELPVEEPPVIEDAELPEIDDVELPEEDPPVVDDVELPVINEDALAKAVGGNAEDATELVARVLGLFQTHAPDALLKLALSARDGGAQEIADATHALQAMAHNIGAQRLARACGMLETDARSGRLEDLADRLEVLKLDLVEVLKVIELRRSTGPNLQRSGSAQAS